MKTKLRQKLFLEANKLVTELFPESTMLHLDNFPSTWRVWELNGGSGFKMFLIVGPAEKRDSFALELAWSASGKLPENNGTHPDDEQGKEEICFRLSQFWQRYGAEHRWYLGNVQGAQELMIPELDAPLEVKFQSIAPQLGDAFAKLKQYGVPYLKQISTQYGIELKVKI